MWGNPKGCSFRKRSGQPFCNQIVERIVIMIAEKIIEKIAKKIAENRFGMTEE